MSEYSKGSVSVLIPAYNEENNIVRAVEQVRRALPGQEIIVIDDGSTDQTFARARECADDRTRVLSLPHGGKGAAIRAGIEASGGSVMAQIDADLQFPAENLPLLIQPVLNGEADIVFGSRYLDPSAIEPGSVSVVKRLASHVMAGIVSAMCRQKYTDVFAGVKAWRADVIQRIDLQEKDFTYEAEIAIKARRLGYRVVEVPVSYKRRRADKSKIKIIYHSLTISFRLVRLFFERT